MAPSLLRQEATPRHGLCHAPTPFSCDPQRTLSRNRHLSLTHFSAFIRYSTMQPRHPAHHPSPAAPQSLTQQHRETYDARYRTDYRTTLRGYEHARAIALSHFITQVIQPSPPAAILDYGAGSGLHVPLWQELFPHSHLALADISPVALDKLGRKHPSLAAACHLIDNDQTSLPAASFDIILSIEVMEHVASLQAYLHEVARLLKPGGRFIWTTPCANALSIEHIYNTLTGKIEEAPGGNRRWTWEDPTHLRRLTSREAKAACADVGLADVQFRYRAHLFSFLCSGSLMRWAPRLAERLMLLDYSLLRRLPNAASMIACATKPA